MGYRASVQGTEERSVDSTHPSPARVPHRSPYLRGVPRLRPDGDAETTAEGAGAGTDAPSRARKTRRHPDDRRRAAYDGRPHGRPGPPYRAGKRPPTPAATPEARPPPPAPRQKEAPPPPPRQKARPRPSARSPERSLAVVPTFGRAPERFQRLRLAKTRQLVKSG